MTTITTRPQFAFESVEGQPARRWLRWGWATIAIGCLTGCDDPSSAPAGTSSGAPPSASVAKPKASANSRHAQPAKKKPATSCAVTALSGKARIGKAAVSVRTRLAGDHWLEVEKGGRVTLKHGDSSREWVVVGPAWILPCIAGEETLALAAGTLLTSPQAGTRPGAMVVVGTPLGSFEYSDAQLEAKVSDGVSIVVTRGAAHLSAGPGATRKGPERTLKGKPGSLSGERAPERHVTACETAATEAAAQAGRIAKSKPGDIGKLTGQHVRMRQRARAACATARAAAGYREFVKPGSGGSDLLQRAATADLRWRSGGLQALKTAPTTTTPADKPE